MRASPGREPVDRAGSAAPPVDPVAPSSGGGRHGSLSGDDERMVLLPWKKAPGRRHPSQDAPAPRTRPHPVLVAPVLTLPVHVQRSRRDHETVFPHPETRRPGKRGPVPPSARDEHLGTHGAHDVTRDGLLRASRRDSDPACSQHPVLQGRKLRAPPRPAISSPHPAPPQGPPHGAPSTIPAPPQGRGRSSAHPPTDGSRPTVAPRPATDAPRSARCPSAGPRNADGTPSPHPDSTVTP